MWLSNTVLTVLDIAVGCVGLVDEASKEPRNRARPRSDPQAQQWILLELPPEHNVANTAHGASRDNKKILPFDPRTRMSIDWKEWSRARTEAC